MGFAMPLGNYSILVGLAFIFGLAILEVAFLEVAVLEVAVLEGSCFKG